MTTLFAKTRINEIRSSFTTDTGIVTHAEFSSAVNNAIAEQESDEVLKLLQNDARKHGYSQAACSLSEELHRRGR